MIKKSIFKLFQLGILFSVLFSNSLNVFAENNIKVVPAPSLIIQIVIFFILVGGIYFLPSIVALFSLKKRKLSKGASILWATIVILFPFLGTMALFIVDPKNVDDNDNSN